MDDRINARRTLVVVKTHHEAPQGQVRHMKQATSSVHPGPASSKDALTEVLRHGAKRMLATAVEAEVATYIEEHEDLRDEEGHRLVVRNGHQKPRTIDTGVGEIEVRQPRVNDRRIDEDGKRIRFSSNILPPYLRRTRSLEDLVPWLYLKGISTNDFSEYMQQLLGTDTASLSPTTVVRFSSPSYVPN